MKCTTIRPCVARLLLISVLITSFSGKAFADEGEGERTESPYFLVMSEEEEGLDLLPLKSTSADVSIAGVIADVRVTQVYSNTGTRALEAVYIFPGSTGSAVYGMRMTIGERVRVAKIKKKAQARAEYNKAKKAGKSASLLEQHRPNVFQMKVANIMPGDEVRVELFYTELLTPEKGVYEFVYPSVVGPRYQGASGSRSASGEAWTGNPYLREGQGPTYAFDLSIGLEAGLPISELRSNSHEIRVDFEEKSQAKVVLAKSEQGGGDRDFILQYRLQGGKIETGLLLYEDPEGNENFFLAMLQPPKRVPLESIPPREFVYIVDVSGSMHGFPLDISKKLLRDLIKSMRPKDTFNVLLFAASSAMLSELSLPVTADNIERAVRFIDRQHGGGGTELLPALERAFAIPKDPQRSRTVVIATDGYVSVETKAFDLIKENLNGANVFAFGIGSGVNRLLIEGIARVGFGHPFIVTKPEEAPAQAARFLEYIATPVLSGVELSYSGFDVYEVEPRVLPDVLAERPVIVFGKWRGVPQGVLDIEGYQGDSRFRQRLVVGDYQPQSANSALRYLWARHRIASIGDYNFLRHSDQRVEEITDLGLKYNLLTKYTSFIAVDDVVRNKEGSAKTVKQPLPLPKGVSNLAVGASVPTVPEPELYALCMVLGVLLLWAIASSQDDLGRYLRGRR